MVHSSDILCAIGNDKYAYIWPGQESQYRSLDIMLDLNLKVVIGVDKFTTSESVRNNPVECGIYQYTDCVIGLRSWHVHQMSPSDRRSESQKK